MVGWNKIQVLILKFIIWKFGMWAGVKAGLGIGFGGTLIAIAGYAGPIGAVIESLILIYKIGDTAWRHILPAVAIVGIWRIRLISEGRLLE